MRPFLTASRWSRLAVIAAVGALGTICQAEEPLADDIRQLPPVEAGYPVTAGEEITIATAEPRLLSKEAASGWFYDDGVVLTGGHLFGHCYGKSASGDPDFPTIKVSGLMQIDALFFSQDDTSKAVVGNVQDVADFRRARLGVKGDVAENVSYQMEYDFGFPGRPNFTNVFLDIKDFGPGHFRVGQWKQPFGMESATSIREVMFLERSLAFSLVPFRQIGAGFYNTMLEERGTWAVSGYRFPTDFFGDVAGDSGYGMTTRETLLLWDNTAHGEALHVGGSYSFNSPATNSVRLRTTPEVGFNQLDFRNATFPVPFFVDSGLVPTEDYQLAGVEFAGNTGPLLFQSEFIWAAINQTGGPQVYVPAAYTQVAYVLTGEYHPYNKQSGAYTRIIPKHAFGPCGNGAWELAGRWSYLDLNDANIAGGRIQDGTLGVNWYLNQFTKMQFNYIHSWLERPLGTNSDADIFAVRAQLDF